MKKSMMWIALGVLGVTGAAGLAVGAARADGPREAAAPDDEGRPHGGRLARLQEELGLTDEQVQQAQAAHEAFREQAREVRGQVRELRRAAAQLFQGSSVTREDLQARQREIHALMGKVGEARVEMIYQVWQILTPEQRAKLGERIGDRMSGDGDEGAGPGGGPGRGARGEGGGHRGGERGDRGERGGHRGGGHRGGGFLGF